MTDRVEDIFPDVREISDERIREKVIQSWEIAIDECPFESPLEAPWGPHSADVVGDQELVRHINEVTTVSISLSDVLSGLREYEYTRDYVIAGALVHDISKMFEYDAHSQTPIREFLVHPHFSVYVLQKANMPLEIQHIAISHTARSGVEPKTIESKIVAIADLMAAESIYWEATGKLKP